MVNLHDFEKIDDQMRRTKKYLYCNEFSKINSTPEFSERQHFILGNMNLQSLADQRDHVITSKKKITKGRN